MNAKTIASVSIFAALTVALNLSPAPKIPAPYMPFLYYQLWEIPIVAAFLLFGPLVGVLIAIINTVVLLGLFPGNLPTGPFYNLAAILGMFLGVYVSYILFIRALGKESEVLLATSSTAIGTVLRVGLMTVVNYALLRFPPPVGYSIPEGAIIAMLPLIGLFNATLALYTIPLGQLLAKAASSGARLSTWGQRLVKR